MVKVFDKLTGGKRHKDGVHQEGDEFIELQLRPGDAYEMNGQMQESYSHCVPKVCRDNSNNQGVTDANAESECYRRISVVLRTGQQTSFKRDSGEACVDLSPRGRITYQFGHITELEEGCLYTRRELKKMKAFQLAQRGISGCLRSGADAIIVSGQRRGEDTLENLKYVAEWRIGANSLFKSFVRRSSIRVFRSARYIRAQNMRSTGGGGSSSNSSTTTTTTGGRRTIPSDRIGASRLYRYDGLYTIAQVKPPVEPNGTFEFFLKRNGGHVERNILARVAATANAIATRKRKAENDRQALVPPQESRCSDSKRLNTLLIAPQKNDDDDDEYAILSGTLPPKTSWADEYGPNDLSCCASVLLLVKELSCICAMSSLLSRKRNNSDRSCSAVRFKERILASAAALSSSSSSPPTPSLGGSTPDGKTNNRNRTRTSIPGLNQ